MFDYSILENKSEEEIVKFLSRGALNYSDIKKSFFLTGSGGSGLIKPNFTSILSLYLSCIPEIIIVKTGSQGVTSNYGSTDFFNDLDIAYGLKYKERLIEIGFLYIDVSEIAPWKVTPYFDVSDELYNKLMRIFNKNSFCDVKCNMKITGITPCKYADVRNIIIHNQSNQCHYLYTEGADFSIDECVIGRTFCDGIIVGDISNEAKYSKNINIKSINRMLLKGVNTDLFWSKSIRKAFGVYSVIMGLFSSYNEASDYFDKIKRDNLLNKKINMLQKVKK